MSQPDQAARRRPGRPNARNPMSYVLYVRMTESDGVRLDDLAEDLNRDRADLVREILLSGMEKMETHRRGVK